MILASPNRSLKSTQPGERCEPSVSVPPNDGLQADLEDDAGVLPAIDDILRDLASAVTREEAELSGKWDRCMQYGTQIRDKTRPSRQLGRAPGVRENDRGGKLNY